MLNRSPVACLPSSSRIGSTPPRPVNANQQGRGSSRAATRATATRADATHSRTRRSCARDKARPAREQSRRDDERPRSDLGRRTRYPLLCDAHAMSTTVDKGHDAIPTVARLVHAARFAPTDHCPRLDEVGPREPPARQPPQLAQCAVVVACPEQLNPHRSPLPSCARGCGAPPPRASRGWPPARRA